MDDVAIANSNPVRTVVAPPPPVQKPKPAGTIVNFFLMMPLALVVLFQGFFLGQSIGGYTTFPFYSIHSYMTMGAILVLLVLVQIFLRSIVYSTLFSVVLVSGIFYTWFGDFMTPLQENFKEVLVIMKSALSNRDIPYPILMSTILTVIYLVMTCANFAFSLFVKYGFEVVFGRFWGDGRKFGYITAIILLLAVQLGFKLFATAGGNIERLAWSQASVYQPLEEFCSRIPSAGIVGKDRVWNYDSTRILAIDSTSGRVAADKRVLPVLPAPMWNILDKPILATRMGLMAFDRDLVGEAWTVGFPASLPGLVLPPEDVKPDQGLPLLLRPDVRPGMVLAMFDYGFWGAYSVADGRQLWLRAIDGQSRLNRYFVEDFIRSPYVISVKEVLVFALQNGRLAAIKAETGEQVWEYAHPDSKFSGKPQRALLSVRDDRVLAAFPSGSLVAFDGNKGTKLYEAHSTQWHPNTAASWEGDEAAFISADGNYVRVVLDGGKIVMNTSLFPNRPFLMPAPINFTRGFAAYKDTIYQIATATKTLNSIFRFPKHVFACEPVVEDAFLYTGTQDGWVFCFHRESLAEKWRIHLSGELAEESLLISENGLLVRTRSGSVFCLKKGFQ